MYMNGLTIILLALAVHTSSSVYIQDNTLVVVQVTWLWQGLAGMSDNAVYCLLYARAWIDRVRASKDINWIKIRV